MSDQTQKKITRLNADTLSQVFDRVTVQALLNMVRITGTDADGITVPELSGQSDETKALLEVVRQQVILLQVVSDYLESAPNPIPPDTSLASALALLPAPIQPVEVQQVESLQIEVRQLSEQVALLTAALQENITPRYHQIERDTEQLQVEVRYLADKQVINTNMIQELRIGTML